VSIILLARAHKSLIFVHWKYYNDYFVFAHFCYIFFKLTTAILLNPKVEIDLRIPGSGST